MISSLSVVKARSSKLEVSVTFGCNIHRVSIVDILLVKSFPALILSSSIFGPAIGAVIVVSPRGYYYWHICSG